MVKEEDMATGTNAQLDGGQELTTTTQKDVYLGNLLRRIIDAVNTTALNAGVSSIGKLPPPPKIDSIAISGTVNGSTNTFVCPSEVFHAVLTHNQSMIKNIHYVHEIDTNSGFTQPHVFDAGCSRSLFIHLPAQDSNGNTITYFHRAYAQMPGSDPCPPTVFGNLSSSTAITMTPPLVTSGSVPSLTSILPSTGSGTASPQGQQGGKGLGTVQQRPAPRPKRSVGLS
jgi:hypothetical protein